MRGVAWAATAALLAVALAACGGDSSADPHVAAEPVAVECPEGLVEPAAGSTGLASGEVATDSPELGHATQAWVCTYAPTGTGQSPEDPQWSLAEGPATVPASSLVEVDALIAALEPAEAMRACTADLGPRAMLVVVTAEAKVGVVVDDFGCRDVRLTDDPWTVAPGESAAEGVPAGVLTGPEGIVATIAGLTSTG